MAGRMSHGTSLLQRALAAWHGRAIGLKAVSFAGVGVINTALDYGIFLLAWGQLGWPIIPANVLAWMIAVSGSYVMNSYITFAKESGRKLRWRDYGTFVASGIAGMVANTTVVYVLSFFIPVWIAKLVAIGVSFVVNFALSHFVVFRPAKPDVEDVRGS
jgi:putative flippase GtrA